MSFYTKIFFLALIISNLIACTKFVDVSPPITRIVGATAYNTSANASAAVTGIYRTLEDGPFGGGNIYQPGLSTLVGLSADELELHQTSNILLSEAYTNSLSSENNPFIWFSFYNAIYQANYAIEALSSSETITLSVRQQLLGSQNLYEHYAIGISLIYLEKYH